MRNNFGFTIEHNIDGALGRAGVISTPHGQIKTPAFIAVATKATLKSLTPEHINGLGAQAVLANAYHLYLQPGANIIDKAGGLGKFMNWQGPTFTDSGGFQVLSLGTGYKKVINMDANAALKTSVAKKSTRMAHVDDDGVNFKSHINGDIHRFTPESAIQIQHQLGADIMFAFDECTSIAQPYTYQIESLERTEQWADRCLKEHTKQTKERTNKPYQALFGVVQGANYKDLRQAAAQFMAKSDFDGFGIGGALEKNQLSDILQWVNNILPEQKPRHLLGLSEPDDIFIGIENGADTFDCVSPARIARSGSIYTLDGRFDITKAKYKEDFNQLVKDCKCYTCTNYTKAYVRHLFKAHERLSATLATIHNEHFIVKLVDDIRQSILEDNFFEFKEQWLKKYYSHFNTK